MQTIMTRAHKIARTLEGDYAARMSFALRQVWAEVRNDGKAMEQRLVEIGGNLWERHGHRRVYFNYNTLAELLGMKLEFYNTGNIRAAWMDGERVSNTHARGYYWDLRNGKIWYDLNTEKFATRDVEGRRAQHIIERIRGAA